MPRKKKSKKSLAKKIYPKKRASLSASMVGRGKSAKIRSHIVPTVIL